MTELGAMLRRIRTDHQELLKDMAERLCVSSAFLSAVESGKKRVPSNFAKKIVDTYGLNSDQENSLISAIELSADEMKINLQDASKNQRTAAVSFAKALGNLSDEDISDLMLVFNRSKGAKFKR